MTGAAPTGRCDLLIQAGRVVCPATNRDGPGAVAVADGRIVAVAAELPSVVAAEAIDIPRGVLLPGLSDLHCHPACRESVFGVDPDSAMLGRGVVRAGSQGDAGADHIDDYVERTIAACDTEIRLAINLSRIGESTERGCFARPDDADVPQCVSAVERHRRHLWAIAVNLSRHACESTDPRVILRRGREAADRTGLPLLIGLRCEQDWPLEAQLQALQPGDVVTYCFRSVPHCIAPGGRVAESVRRARDRGVLFDVGHGAASFDFRVAEACLRDGFPPDTISTDLQRRHFEPPSTGPQHDLPLVLSKLLAAGMDEQACFRAVTSRPAGLLTGSAAVSRLAAGAPADLTVLTAADSEAPLADTHGNRRSGARWSAALVVRRGEIVTPWRAS